MLICYFGDGIDGIIVLVCYIKMLYIMIYLYIICIGICILVNSVLVRWLGFCGLIYVVCYCCVILNMLKIGWKLLVLGILIFILGFLVIVLFGNCGLYYLDFEKIWIMWFMVIRWYNS